MSTSDEILFSIYQKYLELLDEFNSEFKLDNPNGFILFKIQLRKRNLHKSISHFAQIHLKPDDFFTFQTIFEERVKNIKDFAKNPVLCQNKNELKLSINSRVNLLKTIYKDGNSIKHFVNICVVGIFYFFNV